MKAKTEVKAEAKAEAKVGPKECDATTSRQDIDQAKAVSTAEPREAKLKKRAAGERKKGRVGCSVYQDCIFGASATSEQ